MKAGERGQQRYQHGVKPRLPTYHEERLTLEAVPDCVQKVCVFKDALKVTHSLGLNSK